MRRRREKRREEAPDRRLGRWASWATVAAIPIGAVALVLAFLALPDEDEVEPVVVLGAAPLESPRSAEPSEPEPTGVRELPSRLEKVDLIVRNGSFLQGKPRLELMVHNTGGGRAVISRAKIEVLRRYRLPLCFTQGGFSLSGSYDAQIPASAGRGYVVETPLHQQVGPTQPDRFEIAMGVVPEKHPTFFGLYLFELGVSLVHDGEPRTLPMGRALVSIPEAPDAGGYFLADGEFKELAQVFTPGGYFDFWDKAKPCWRSNTKILRRALASEAARSPQVKAIEATMVTPTRAQLEP